MKSKTIAALAGISIAIALTSCRAAGDPVSTDSSEAAEPVARLTAEQLDALTAPIALYSDPLIAQILTAATYPLELVEASRWLDDPSNASLRGDALDDALQQQSWDVSVKSLVPFPDLVRMMNTNLQWTEQIGDAFLAQDKDVMDSIQRLRQRAKAAGTLASSPQQIVGSEGDDVTIEPASPTVVYVPYYDPNVVYGPWPWPDYPPFYFPVPGIYAGPGIVFGVGLEVIAPLWGGYYWDWPHRGLFIPERSPRTSPLRPGRWQHDPDHRRGVPYHDAATAARFLGPGARVGRDFRGFTAAQRPPLPAGSAVRSIAPGGRLESSEPRSPAIAPRAPTTVTPRAHPAAPFTAPRSPPVFESFGRGPQVRGEAARGTFSRSAPAVHAAPAPRGGGGSRR